MSKIIFLVSNQIPTRHRKWCHLKKSLMRWKKPYLRGESVVLCFRKCPFLWKKTYKNKIGDIVVYQYINANVNEIYICKIQGKKNYSLAYINWYVYNRTFKKEKNTYVFKHFSETLSLSCINRDILFLVNIHFFINIDIKKHKYITYT